MPDSITSFTYPISVTLLHVAGFLLLRRYIHQTKKKRIKSIKRRDIPDAIETDSPIEDQESDLKVNALEGSEGRFNFILNVLPYMFFSLWFILISLPYLGRIPSVYVSIIAAVISVVAGFSLRPFLENLFSGIIITFFRSVKVGDTVHLEDHYGLIEEIGLIYSVIKKWNWIRVVIPNSQLLQKEILNYSLNDEYIWTHIEFSVARHVDINLVKKLAIESAKESGYLHQAEEPSMWVIELGRDSVKCWLAGWAVNAAEAWELRSEMRLNLLIKLQKQGVEGHVINIKNAS